MNREKAKLLLQSYRPGGQDRDDPQFAEALDLVEQDPVLKQWFQDQSRFDQAISASLQSVPVPADLQAKLLTEVRNVRSGAVPKALDENWWTRPWERLRQVLAYPVLDLTKARAPIAPSSPVPVWRSRPILAIAAGLILLACLTGYWNTRPVTFTDFCQEITDTSWDFSPHLQFESQQLSEVRNWLATQKVHTQLDLPAGLQNAPIRGCSLLQYRGRKIPVLCLLEGSCHMHLLIVDGVSFAKYPGQNNPELIDFGPIRTASWSNKDRIYVLTGMNVRTFVKKFRQSGHWNLAS